jgi:hypothetical protein
MSMQSRSNLDHRLNRNAIGAVAASIARPIATYGEIFADGGTTELVRGEPDGVPQPMIWDGRSEIVGSIVEHDGQLYELAPTEASSQRRAEQRHHLCLRL